MRASSKTFSALVGRIFALYSAASPGIVTAQLAVPALISELGLSGRLKHENGLLVKKESVNLSTTVIFR